MRVRTAITIGLLLAASTSSATASVPSKVRTVVLNIHHSHFSVSELHVRKGEKLRFVVRNSDPINHELIVGPLPVQLRHEAGRRAWHPPIPGEVSVRLFGTASTSYRFTGAGGVLFGCHLPGHWAYGMQGRIIVS